MDSLRAVVRGYARLQRQQVTDGCGGGYGRCLVLTELRNGALSQVELTARLEIEKAWLSRTVASLLEHGMVARKPHERDGRTSVLALTAKGRREAEAIDARLDAFNESLLGKLTKTERAGLEKGLRALRLAMKGEA